jgi:hypothetical protein
MPPCLKPLDGFVVWTGDPDFYEIEKTFFPKLTNTLPGNQNTTSGLGESKAEIVSSDGLLEQDSTYKFTVFTTGDLPKGAFFTLTVPELVGMPENPASSIVMECLTGCSTNLLTIAWSSVTRVLTFRGVVPEVSSYLSAPGPMEFTVKGFTNALST